MFHISWIVKDFCSVLMETFMYIVQYQQSIYNVYIMQLNCVTVQIILYVQQHRSHLILLYEQQQHPSHKSPLFRVPQFHLFSSFPTFCLSLSLPLLNHLCVTPHMRPSESDLRRRQRQRVMLGKVPSLHLHEDSSRCMDSKVHHSVVV